MASIIEAGLRNKEVTLAFEKIINQKLKFLEHSWESSTNMIQYSIIIL